MPASGPASVGSFRMSGFSLDLKELSSGLSHVRVEAPARELGLPEADWADSVVGEFDVERNGDRISVRGTIEGQARPECVRCLKGFQLAVEAPFEVFAERAGAGIRAEEKELERDDYMMFHDGRRLDLAEPAREAMLLEMPYAPHCREDCRGLCPRCGADLNLESCRCEGSRAGAAEQ